MIHIRVHSRILLYPCLFATTLFGMALDFLVLGSQIREMGGAGDAGYKVWYRRFLCVFAPLLCVKSLKAKT